MARARRICSVPGCPSPAVTSRCQHHEREHDKARGTREQRGYGREFMRVRREWSAKINQGGVTCWRCGKPIRPGMDWHLGHDDHDRSIIRGPECALCNLSAAGKASHRRDDVDPRGETPGG